jgi:hypothetical protein
VGYQKPRLCPIHPNFTRDEWASGNMIELIF